MLFLKRMMVMVKFIKSCSVLFSVLGCMMVSMLGLVMILRIRSIMMFGMCRCCVVIWLIMFRVRVSVMVIEGEEKMLGGVIEVKF